MNIKKSFFVALAAVTAISTVSAVAVSAAELGKSESETTQTKTVDPEKDTDFDVKVNDVEIDVTVPAGAAEAGDLTFHADFVTASPDVKAAIDALSIKDADVLDMYFTNEKGDRVSFQDKKLTVKVKSTKYIESYVYEDADKKLTKLGATKETDGLKFVAPHFSYYVLEKTTTTSQASSTSSQSSTNKSGTTGSTSSSTGTTSNTGKGDSVTTGDAATASTVAVFAVMGIVALGTAVVASKMKKTSK